MSRIDKTDSAVGVVRAELEADIPDNLLNTVVGVGLNAKGHVIFEAGQSGIVGVMNPSKFARRAGMPVDIFVLGDAVDVGLELNDPDLTAGSRVYAAHTNGALSSGAPADLTTATAVGWTVEADHLVIRL